LSFQHRLPTMNWFRLLSLPRRATNFCCFRLPLCAERLRRWTPQHPVKHSLSKQIDFHQHWFFSSPRELCRSFSATKPLESVDKVFNAFAKKTHQRGRAASVLIKINVKCAEIYCKTNRAGEILGGKFEIFEHHHRSWHPSEDKKLFLCKQD
jgi:hypothetical protein